MKWELHAHCSEISPCGRVPAREVVNNYHENGYDGLVLTDHYNAKTLLTLPGSGAEKVENWLNGYRLAREAGEKCGLTVLFGLEATLTCNENDFLILGVSPDFLRANPNLHLGTLRQLHQAVRQAGGLLIQAHPYRDEICFPENAQDLDGVEVFNGCPRHDNHNDRTRAFAKEHPHLICTSGSDYHRLQDLGLGGIETERNIQSGAELVKCLKENAFTRIEGC